MLTLFVMMFVLLAHAQKMDAKSKELIDGLIEVNGGYNTLLKAKDVQFKYIKDVYGEPTLRLNEKHIFRGEHSFALYTDDSRGLDSIVKMALLHGEGHMSLNGRLLEGKKEKKKAAFLSSLTFYWFAMSYKLLDPGTIFTYLGKERIRDVELEKVKMVFDNSKTKKKLNDEYLLYFNPQTHLIDFFMYSRPGGNVLKDPITKYFAYYEIISGVYVPTKRVKFTRDENGIWSENGTFTFYDVKFNNGFTTDDFMSELSSSEN